MTIAPLLVSLFWDPQHAAALGAGSVGHPAMLPELERICHRETVGPGAGRCRAVSVHRIDAWTSPRAYQRGVRARLVDPECQPYRPGQWGTRGSFGLLAAFQLHWWRRCADPRELDVPLVSAVAAARKLAAHCAKPKRKRHPATVRWGRCDWRKNPDPG